MPDKNLDYVSLGFIIITSLFAQTIWFAVRNIFSAVAPEYTCCLQFHVTISRKDLFACRSETYHFMIVICPIAWIDCISSGRVYNFLPLHASPHAITVKPVNGLFRPKTPVSSYFTHAWQYVGNNCAAQESNLVFPAYEAGVILSVSLARKQPLMVMIHFLLGQSQPCPPVH